MKTHKKAKPTPRSRGIHSMTQPPAEPQERLLERARRLPFSGPGLRTDVAIPLLPTWYTLNHLEAMSLEEVAQAEKLLGRRKQDGEVWVKRIQKEEPHV